MSGARTTREAALWIWEQEFKEPYVWGGDSPLEGWDCSGVVNEGLKSVGLLGREEDATAYDLSHRFRVIERAADLQPGCLLFYNRGTPPRIGHVVIVWAILEDGTILTLGAEGGGSATKSVADATKAHAYVKIRPALLPYAIAVDPFLP